MPAQPALFDASAGAAPPAQAPPAQIWPARVWPSCAIDALDDALRQAAGGWTLVEFWAPDVLFSRLLAPIRARLPHSHAGRLRLLFCPVDAAWSRCAAFGVDALPALVLFHGARRVRRWRGAIEPRLLAHDIDAVLADATP